jgi:hypothetical protein
MSPQWQQRQFSNLHKTFFSYFLFGFCSLDETEGIYLWDVSALRAEYQCSYQLGLGHEIACKIQSGNCVINVHVLKICKLNFYAQEHDVRFSREKFASMVWKKWERERQSSLPSSLCAVCSLYCKHNLKFKQQMFSQALSWEFKWEPTIHAMFLCLLKFIYFPKSDKCKSLKVIRSLPCASSRYIA